MPNTPLRLGVATTFGPWTVRCDIVDAVDASGSRRLDAPPLDVWDVVRGDFEYHLPLLEVDEAAAVDPSAALQPGAAGWLGLRIAAAPHLPPVRDMELELRAALPLVVCGCAGNSSEFCPAPAPGAAEDSGADGGLHAADAAGAGDGSFAVRRWSAAALEAPRCVRVRTTYTRPPRARQGAGDVPLADDAAAAGEG